MLYIIIILDVIFTKHGISVYSSRSWDLL